MKGKHKCVGVYQDKIVKNRQKHGLFFNSSILDAFLGRQYNKKDVKEIEEDV